MPKLPESLEDVQEQVQPPIFENPEILKGLHRLRRDRIGALLMQRHSIEDIARELGIPESQVEQEVGQTKQNWSKRRMLLDAERIEEELAQLEFIRELAYRNYEDSQRGKVISERSRELGEQTGLQVTDLNGNSSVQPVGFPQVTQIPATKLRRRKESSPGDIAALRLALDVSGQVRKLLGIDAPEVKRLNINSNVKHTYDYGQLIQLDPTELAELHRSALEQSRTA